MDSILDHILSTVKEKVYPIKKKKKNDLPTLERIRYLEMSAEFLPSMLSVRSDSV